ncbi:MAG: DUF2243 domain-containing protein [Pseudomonadota bacterium]|nr:DUF2243 domain-containing protein [Pseudomonadota bacterium]
MPSAAFRNRPLLLAATVLGIGLGGFFDGILLHQVLQWHHLLSLVPGEAFRDLGTQILADGLFHVLMYAVTASGLWLLWRRRGSVAESGAAGTLAGGALLGFGIWNLIDVGFFHWILGIHRIRVNVPDPMTYDLGWLALFGIIPLGAAWAILRRPPSGSGHRGATAGAALSILALIAAPLAALPVPGSSSALVLFAPGTTPGTAMNAVLASKARLLWADKDGRMMAVALDPLTGSAPLYRAGAMLVTRSPMLAGCAAAAI